MQTCDMKMGAAGNECPLPRGHNEPCKQPKYRINFRFRYAVSVQPNDALMAHARSLADADGTIDVRTALRQITRDAFASALNQPFGAPVAGDTPLIVNVS